jgi:hypothetical protein
MVSRLPSPPKYPVALSKCALKFATAISDPFSVSALGACIPSINARPSQKITAFTRFDTTIGTGGFGFVLLSPCLANDSLSAWYSDGNFTGTTATFTTTASNTSSTTGVNAVYMSNLPYSSSQLTANNQGVQSADGRIVSFGATVQYTGTTLNESGLVWCYHDPTHDNMFGKSTSTLGSRMETSIEPNGRSKCMLPVFPVDQGETEYASGQYVYNGVNTSTRAITSIYPFANGDYLTNADSVGNFTNASCPAVILFTGTPGQAMHVELVIHAEFVGTLVEGKATPSDADPVGLSKVLSAASSIPERKISAPNKSMGELMYDGLLEAGKELIPVGINVIKAALLGLAL